jgi:hypothetical protein
MAEVKSSRRRIRCAAGNIDREDESAGHADSLVRPLPRRAARIARPARVRMRSRKPCVLARRRLFGWKVRLLTTGTPHGHETTRQETSGRRGRWTADHTQKRRAGARPTNGTGRHNARSNAELVGRGTGVSLRPPASRFPGSSVTATGTGSCGHRVEASAAPSLGSARRPSPIARRGAPSSVPAGSTQLVDNRVDGCAGKAPDKHRAPLRATNGSEAPAAFPDCPNRRKQAGRAGREHVCDGVVGVPAGPVG